MSQEYYLETYFYSCPLDHQLFVTVPEHTQHEGDTSCILELKEFLTNQYIAQEVLYNPLKISKNETIFQKDPWHLENWINDCNSQELHSHDTLRELKLIHDITKRFSVPFLETYQHFNDLPWIPIAPIAEHALIFECPKMVKNSTKKYSLTILRKHAPCGIHRKTFPLHHFKDDNFLDFLRQILLRRSNLDYNHTSVTESRAKYARLRLYALFLFPSLLFYFVTSVLGYSPPFHIMYDMHQYIDDRNFYLRPGFFGRLGFFFFSSCKLFTLSDAILYIILDIAGHA